LNDVFHYPPDLFDLVVQTIPLLNRSKKSVLLFFKGAGVKEPIYSDISQMLESNKDSINKYEITRQILERINENSEHHLRERRELLKRIIEFEAFSTCWPDDQLKAKGLVAEIQSVINVKDSFTRMNQAREKEASIRRDEQQKKLDKVIKHKEILNSIKNSLYALFTEQNAQKRGKALERVLNDYFKEYHILVKEDFKRTGETGDGIIEQIDGIVDVDNTIYLVEMKWKKDPIGSDDIYAHLGRIYHRTNAHGIFISASRYTPSGITAAKEAQLKDALLILFDLEELVRVIEQEMDFRTYIRNRIQNAIIEKDPYKKSY
jgi:restriction system protein